MARLLPHRIRADLFAQLGAMEQAGLPPAKAWGLLKLAGVPAATLEAVQKAVARGSNPAIAAQNAGLFTPLEGQLVRAALAAGSPAPVYQRLAEDCAQRAQNASAIRARLLLPGGVLVLALFIQGLPQLVTGVITPGTYLLRVITPLLLIGITTLLAARWAKSVSAQGLLRALPLVGPAIVRRNACNFFASLALLLEAGVPMFEALPMAVATIDDRAMRGAYARIKPAMQRGAILSAALDEQITDVSFLGNAHVIDFIRTGEASGTLPEMLMRHTRAEAEALALFWQQVAQWLPRLAYAAVAAWMAYGLLIGGAFAPHVPTDI